METPTRTILVIGASRGLGLGLTGAFLDRHWSVVATCREDAGGLSDLKARAAGLLRIERLDINESTEAETLRAMLEGVRLDILFVNAGVMDDRRAIGEVETDTFTRLLVTNALSPLRMIERFAPLVAPEGVIAVMSSGLGSVGSNTSGGYEVYRASKAALNSLLRSYAARDPHRAVLAMSPGWVRTDMGGAAAALDVETSARGIAEVLTTRAGIPGAAFLNYHGKPMPW